MGTAAILWIGFVIALFMNHAWLDLIWDGVQMLPLMLQIIIWLFFLPVMVGLWIWQSAWATPVNLLVLAGMLVWMYAAASGLRKIN